MRKIALLLLGCVLFSTACNQSNTNPTIPNNPALNATEQQLIGTWKLERQITSVGTTVIWDSTYNPLGNLYATFKSSITSEQQGVIAQSNYKDIDDNASLITGNTSPSGRNLMIGKWYWYVSNINNQLYVGLNTFSSYDIDTITSNKLVLTNTISGQITKLWLIK